MGSGLKQNKKYCHLEVNFLSESSELSYLSTYIPTALSGSFGTVHRAEWHGSVRTFYLKFAWLISKSMVLTSDLLDDKMGK